ncbi:ankyrin repeat domain-containing protein [Legionella brunensis]|uniref:Ankyrin repeat protein n=1 Tax=Legionella brunensis TaxID=29422 RepID=A0A0W0S1I3_9GAMM|nr:ankyrin repeat domain-containing protein [Legionella brunensis]KTC76789.1 ankyrin repeat protein [Legionella brunensis]
MTDRNQFRLIDRSLHEAIMDGNRRQAQLIIEKHDGDVNSQDQYGASPALLAAKRNDFEMLQLLVEKGADVTLSDYMGFTAMQWAQENRNEKMADFIEEHSNPAQMRM